MKFSVRNLYKRVFNINSIIAALLEGVVFVGAHGSRNVDDWGFADSIDGLSPWILILKHLDSFKDLGKTIFLTFHFFKTYLHISNVRDNNYKCLIDIMVTWVIEITVNEDIKLGHNLCIISGQVLKQFKFSFLYSK
jgi:hypothetical protein